MPITKRAAVEAVIKDCEKWLQDQKIMDFKTIVGTRQKYQISTEKVVSLVERFALPMHRINKLEWYCEEELRKAKLLCAQEDFGPTIAKFPELPHILSRVAALSPDKRKFVPAQLSRICKILLLK